MDTKKAAAWFIIGIMVLSIAGFIGGGLSSGTPNQVVTQEFNGYTFTQQNNQWVVTINNQKYGFLFLPQELQSISLPTDVTSWRNKDKIYLVQDRWTIDSFTPDSSLNLVEAVFYANNVRLQKACFTTKDCPDFPIISCTSPTLVVRSPSTNTTETKLSSDDQCIILETPSSPELEKITERIIYQFLGVMP